MKTINKKLGLQIGALCAAVLFGVAGAAAQNARRAATGGRFEIIAQAPRVLWADTMSVAADGFLYFTANQLHRQAAYNNGRDLRQKPYRLFRVRTGAAPIRLR